MVRKKPKQARAARLLREMQRDAPVLQVRFFRQGDSEPVREWLHSLPKFIRHKIGTDVQAVHYEIRTSVDGDIYRVFFCNIQHTMVLLHGFMKKTQQTPKPDLDLARNRQKAAKEALS